ncbi:diguanylate cyclase [Candidatus Latescibacterota bacterium]
MSIGKPKVFIIDNEIEICNLMKDFFDFVGFDSLCESDGDKGFKNLNKIDYDIMFVDLRFNGTVSGIDILRKSKKVHPLSEVIIITGYGSEETIRETLRYGAFAYLQKPISFAEIKVHTAEALAKRRFNIKTEGIRNILTSADTSLTKHFEDIIHFDRLSEFLNLTIDINTLSESILTGVSSLIPGHFYSFLFFDDINKEMVISSPDPVCTATITEIRNEVRDHFEKIASVGIGDSYHLKTLMPRPAGDTVCREATGLLHVFVPILIENTIHGILGVSREKIKNTDYIEDILRIVANRISVVLANAALYRNTKLLALTDGLTGLLNRSAFHERLESEYQRFKRYGSPLSLIVSDLDNLKEINDSRGHPVGDEVLRTIGDILRETTRESDILTRYGGDEFVVVLPQTNTQNAVNLAERIRIKIGAHPFSVNGEPFHCTISLGVATAPSERITTAKDLLETADHAMYDSKQSGRNQVSVLV